MKKYGSIIKRKGVKYFVVEDNPRTYRVRKVISDRPQEDTILSHSVTSLWKKKKPIKKMSKPFKSKKKILGVRT